MDKQYTDAEIVEMWYEMGGITYKNTLEDVVIAHDWRLWKAGTSVFDIRKWFNDNHSKGLAYLQERL